MPTTVPKGPSAVASFGISNLTGIQTQSQVRINRIEFNPGASAYMIASTPKFFLSLGGVGIVNNSGITQNFFTVGNTSGSFVGISFAKRASAGTGTVFTNADGNDAKSGGMLFSDSSTAGSGTIINEPGGTSRGLSSLVLFEDATSAANATITNKGGLVSAAQGGTTMFLDSASAGNATIINDGARPSAPKAAKPFSPTPPPQAAPP